MKNTLLILGASLLIIFPISKSHGVLPFFLTPLVVKPALSSVIPFLILILTLIQKKWRNELNLISVILLTVLFWLTYNQLGTNAIGIISITSSSILHIALIYLVIKKVISLVNGRT